MNTNGIVASVKGQTNLMRPLFGPGMLLQHEDLECQSNYTRDLSRLLFRSFFGCGVVCGLTVDSVDEKCGMLNIVINPGLALDSLGDPVQLPGKTSLSIGGDCKDLGKTYWLILCRKSKCCVPRSAMCSSDDDKPASQSTRQYDGYELRAMNKPPSSCVCQCPQKDTPATTPPAEKPAGGGGAEGTGAGPVVAAAAVATPPPKDTTKPPSDDTKPQEKCLCADPDDPCYHDHYEGKCACQCSDDSDCECNCIVLARLYKNDFWKCDYSLRRFIRPVLMRDPAPDQEKKRLEELQKSQQKPKGEDSAPK